ncbi:hypothetical protein ACFFK0_02495 [Paenibacillus chartarius]|uniref:Uncharacterized protein n=1 Tax=Paenibacillus chartarius TaxID=747481 RepID=A0ABV6DFB2_9BACL
MLTDVQERLSELKEAIDGLQLDQASAANARKTCEAYGNQLLLDGSALLKADMSHEQKREVIAGMRQAVHKLQETTRELMSQCAEAYRGQIGTEEKEAYEKLSKQLQQEYKPEAFRSLQAYHQVGRLHDLLSSLNTELLDADFELEREMRQSGTTERTADEAPPFGADPLKYDHDPVPGSLSP